MPDTHYSTKKYSYLHNVYEFSSLLEAIIVVICFFAFRRYLIQHINTSLLLTSPGKQFLTPPLIALQSNVE